MSFQSKKCQHESCQNISLTLVTLRVSTLSQMNPRLNLRPIAPSEVNRQALSYYFYMQLVEVISRLRSAWHDSNSDLVGRIFSLEFGFDVSQKDFERIIRKELEPPLSDATVSLVKRSLALRQNNIPEAYRAHTAMTKSLLLAPGDPTFRWALAPVLFRDLRRLAAAVCPVFNLHLTYFTLHRATTSWGRLVKTIPSYSRMPVANLSCFSDARLPSTSCSYRLTSYEWVLRSYGWWITSRSLC